MPQIRSRVSQTDSSIDAKSGAKICLPTCRQASRLIVGLAAKFIGNILNARIVKNGGA